MLPAILTAAGIVGLREGLFRDSSTPPNWGTPEEMDEYARKFADWEEPESLYAEQEWPDWMNDRHHFSVRRGGEELVDSLSRSAALNLVQKLGKGNYEIVSNADGRTLQFGYEESNENPQENPKEG